MFEYIDLTRPQQKHIRERSGWMGYMFSDIRQADGSAETYSIIRPDKDERDAANFAKDVLKGE